MAGKSVDKFVVMATGKLEGKARVWVAAVFNDVRQAKPWVALLNLAHKAGDAETVASMDVHAPLGKDDIRPTEVKYSGAVVQYAPETTALVDDTTLG